ncbi:hypothetical protein RI129_002927 [Pyrocoelia pectoralis]|uniref:Uncharacterized protein n=1 Tax=Pyrocoelia pectoralis TaxID=417401 RepID=A0AAN7ZI97_9COLE
MKGKSGRCPTRFLFFKQLDKILGSEPNISSPHSIDPSESGEVPCHQLLKVQLIQRPLVKWNVDENTNNEIYKDLGQDTKTQKLHEELKILQTKIHTKSELEERKLSLLEQKLKLDERKVITLEKLAGIN